jgi:hypothetical protein
MPYDSHGSRMNQADTKRQALRVHGVTEKPPIAAFHTVEILLLDPAGPLHGDSQSAVTVLTGSW